MLSRASQVAQWIKNLPAMQEMEEMWVQSLPSGPGMLTGALAPSPQSALLEEQKSVMHKCGEERRRLAAEWAEFFAQQKLSKERAEREAERALQVDTQREGTLISLAKVGPRASRTVGTPHSPASLPTLALTV